MVSNRTILPENRMDHDCAAAWFHLLSIYGPVVEIEL